MDLTKAIQPLGGDAETLQASLGKLVTMVPTKSDVERAAELKVRLQQAFRPLVELMDEAARDGFLVRWAAVQPGPFGKHEILDLHLLKKF